VSNDAPSFTLLSLRVAVTHAGRDFFGVDYLIPALSFSSATSIPSAVMVLLVLVQTF
jgi:hypothetical protein